MGNMKKMVFVNIITLIILVAGGFAGYYYYDQSTNYIKTDNAKIDGQQIVISSPAAGKLESWSGTFGKTFSPNESIGKVLTAPQTAGDTVHEVSVSVPTNATIVQANAIKDQLVGTGSTLGYAYNLDNLWVTANIKETEVEDVKKGQEVDVYVDAYPDTTLTGTVEFVGLTTANTFSLLPSGNSNANYTKVEQVVPVRIALDHNKSFEIVPGMNASVRIHK
ncbi:multidrug efflux protein [Bacillus sp. AFS001701]|uniref:HlyD family secretion protein n=1 Tax=Bacillus sp. AFS001701 TaxID=2033480 RepID=UPI000BF8BD00|nr:efflux RND transporter periplasmic adaptor subunit [Bacillus sp. AFS001701]PET54714.1 multidrug efflux protein [Bacillus sp. AFS001701]